MATISFGLPGGASFLRSVPRPTTKISLVAGLAKPTERRRSVTTTPKNSDGDKTPSSRRTNGPDATWCKKWPKTGIDGEPSDCASAASQLRHCEPVQGVIHGARSARGVVEAEEGVRRVHPGRGKEGKEDVSAVMKSVKSFFDASVLETLCEKGLKKKVPNELDCHVPEAKSNIRILYELVRVKAKEQAIELRPMKKANPSNSKHSRKEQKTAGSHQHNKRRIG
ncbi:hypothetical protein GQ600_6505 [Phytophthora cactorum]|nr:hypothetical protein GQ600_6505 [Phytophthora cactorum]